MLGLLFYLYALLANDSDNKTVERDREFESSPSRIWKFYVDPDSGRMVSVHSDLQNNKTVGCYVSAERIFTDYVERIVPKPYIIFVDKPTIDQLIDSCASAKLNRLTSDDDGEEVWRLFGRLSGLFILPGTKWCGAGTIATSKNDLGPAVEADKCCRDHDFCDDYILGGGVKHGLRNDSPFTKSHCKCDSEFHSCLKKARTRTSNLVGIIYFDCLQLQCFKKDHPVTRCKKYAGYLRKRCIEYEHDRLKKKEWQLFDPKFYKWVLRKNAYLERKGDVFDYMIQRTYKEK